MDEEELEQSNKVDISSFFGSIQSIDRVAKNALNSSNTSLKASRSNLDLIKAIQASFESLRAEVQEISRYILIEQDERSKILAQREQAAAQREDDIQKGIFNAEDAREKALTDDKPFSGKNRFLEGITGGLSNIIEQNQDLIAGAGAATILGAIPFNFGRLVPGSGDADTVNAKLTPGEFVVPKDTVEEYGSNFFNDLIKKNENSFANVNEEFFFDTSTPKTNKNKHPRFQNFENFKYNYGPGSTERKEEYYNKVREVITPKMFQEFSNMNKSGKSNEKELTENKNVKSDYFIEGYENDYGDAPTYVKDADGKFVVAPTTKQLTEGFSTYDEDFDYFVKPEKKEDKGIFGGLFGGNKKNENVRNNDKNVKFNTYDLRNYDDDFSDPFFDDGVGFDELINDDSTVKSEDRRGLLGMIGGTIDAATGNLTDFDRRGGKPFGLMRGITGSIDAMTGGLTDLDRRGGKPFGLMRGLTGSIDAMTGGLTDLDRRGGKPSGTMRLATGVADAMTRNLFDFDRRGDGKEEKLPPSQDPSHPMYQKIQELKNKRDQLEMKTTVNPDGSITSKGSGTFIAGEIVRPGEPLSPKQRAAITMGIQMGNTYSSEIMENYNNSGGSPSKEEFDNYEKEKSKDIRPEEEKSKNITPERTLGEKVLNRFSFLPGINKSEKTEKMKIAGEMQDVEIGDDGFPTEDAIEKMTQGIGRKSDKKPQGLMRSITGIADHMTRGLTDFDKRGKGIFNPFSSIDSDKNVKLDKSTRPIPQNVTQPLDDEDETVILPPLSSPTPPPVETPPPAIPPSFGRSNNTTTLVGETDSSIPYIEVISNHYLSIP